MQKSISILSGWRVQRIWITYEWDQFTHGLSHHPNVLLHRNRLTKLINLTFQINWERTLLMYISTIAFGQQTIRTNKSAMLVQDKKSWLNFSSDGCVEETPQVEKEEVCGSPHGFVGDEHEDDKHVADDTDRKHKAGKEYKSWKLTLVDITMRKQNLNKTKLV